MTLRLPPDVATTARQWALLLVAGLAAGWVFAKLQVPAAPMLGPMLVAGVLALRGAVLAVPRTFGHLAQGVSGCLIALSIDATVLDRMVDLWPIVILFVVLTFTAACTTGLVTGRRGPIGREVAIWGFLPGMASTVIAISHDRGLDSRMVAFIQILRLMVVIVTMAGLAALLAGPVMLPVGSDHLAPDISSTFLVLGCAAAGVAVARWLPLIPAGATLVPLVLGTVATTMGLNLAIPGWLLALAFLFLGAQVGLGFTPAFLRTGLAALPRVVAASLLLIALCGLSGLLLSVLTGVDLLSAVLATVPGSIESITLIAISAGADVSFVMTLQTIRLFAVVILGPPVATALTRLASRDGGAGEA